jgi:LPXTG-motif cell wall-anchored protein
MSEIDQMDAPDRKKLIYDQWLDALTYTPYTQLANLTGEPALSLPTFVSSNGLPLGIQLNAATGEDRLLLEFGQLFEDNKQFKLLKQEEEVPEESTDSSSSESEVPEESTDSSLNESGSVEESSNSSTKESSEKDTTPSSSKEEIKKTDSTNNSHNQQKKRLESSNTSSPSTQSLPKTGEKKIVLLPVIGVILLVLLGIIVLFQKKNK